MLVHDIPKKGKALSIALGSDNGEFFHVIDSRIEIREVQNKQGLVISLEITDSKEVITLIVFRLD